MSKTAVCREETETSRRDCESEIRLLGEVYHSVNGSQWLL
jgi:hypothetical protein